MAPEPSECTCDEIRRVIADQLTQCQITIPICYILFYADSQDDLADVSRLGHVPERSSRPLHREHTEGERV